MSVKKWQLQPFNGCARVPECLPTGSLAYGPTGMRACLRAACEALLLASGQHSRVAAWKPTGCRMLAHGQQLAYGPRAYGLCNAYGRHGLWANIAAGCVHAYGRHV